MKSLWKLIAITLAIGFFACACAAPVTAPLSSARALSDVQRIYKNATLVVMENACRRTLTAMVIPATTFALKR